MIRHVVLFRRKEGVTLDLARESALIERMKDLGDRIPVIHHWRVAANEVERPVSWHYVLESEVNDARALDACLLHPLHQALAADFMPYFDWAVVDYTV